LELTDATCIVTGAATAIGQATVAELAACGVAVIAVDDDAEALEAIGAGARVIAADITTPRGREEAIAAAGRPTHLVAVPAKSPTCPLAEVSAEHWEEVFAANARAVFFLLQAVCPLLPPGGAVVNVASVAGKTSRNPEVAVYSASEAAILSLTRSFANAYAGAGVRVNAICTGIIETAENERYLREVAAARGTTVEEIAAARFSLVPMRRAGTPAECARTVRYLLSDDAGFVTGQALNVTGGFHNY